MIHWKHNANGNQIVRSNQNPILDTCFYEVEFHGREMKLAINIIAELMYAKCDIGKKEYLLLKAFIDHRKNGSALNGEDQKIVAKRQKALRKSTAGLDICCKWKDSSTLWKKISNLKESHPI